MTQSNIYLDFNATTPVHREIQQKILEWVQMFGNPSSIHQHGRGPKKLLRESRRIIAGHLNCHPLEIVFTSGGSEANNLALQGCLQAIKKKSPERRKVLIGAIEHPSVANQSSAIQEMGFEVVKIPVSHDGEYDMEFYQKNCDESVAMVSVMLANNEVGIIAPIGKMVSLSKKVGAIFHSDCVQALGKIDFNLIKLGVDLATFSSHKVYALKGAGVLFIKKGVPLEPLVFGGSQERYRRAGTENILAIASLALRVQNLETQKFYKKTKELRDHLESQLTLKLSNCQVLGQKVQRLPNTTALKLSGFHAETMLMNLDIRGFSVGTGAACSSGSPEPSPGLLALGLTREEAQSSLRISLGESTSLVQVDSFIKNLVEVVHHLQSLEASGENHECIQG